ncbi:MAG: PSP1 C-terminal domain-containing protein [Isosphaerales bacterium]
MGERTYLIRYGVMSQVGRFTALPECDADIERGQVVVIQSHRGLELGEVLIPHDRSATARSGGDAPPARLAGEGSGPAPSVDRPSVLRLAAAGDLARADRARESRSSRFTLCQRVLEEGNWPWELIDVEPLLDGRATVLHYLGPQHLDLASLRARFRVACDLDVVLEPAGTDLEGDASHERAHQGDGQAGCGSCDCGAGGGCGSATALREERGAPAVASGENGSTTAPHAGCASCGISQLRAARSRQRA